MDAVEKREYGSIEDADRMYETACRKLMNVNGWTEYAGLSEFLLIDPSGVRAERSAQLGDYIRIDIPGPGPLAGLGYDWVRIEQLDELTGTDERIKYLTVRPSSHPLSKKEGTAHFLDSLATSTFLIRQNGLVVSAQEHGRNELPNSSQLNMIDKGRNFLVGMAAKIGFSYPQWKRLVTGLLDEGHF